VEKPASAGGPPTEAVFAAVREAATREAWSGGVTLVRAGAVSGESASGGELVLRVTQRQGMVTQRIVLHPAEPDWSCDCASDDDPCAHVAAAVIALRRAAEEGRDLFAAGATAEGRIGYRFTRSGGQLCLERVVVAGAGEHVLTSTLAAVASGRVEGPRFGATAADVDAERALGTRLRGALPPGVLAPLLRALERCADVSLDGRPIHVSAEPAAWEARVEDAPGGFVLRAEPVPRIDERFANGAVRCGDELRPGLESRLTGRELEDLSRGRAYPADRVAELVGEVLPELARRVRVDVRSERLPRGERERPRLRLELSREGDRLVVLPLVVYGDPPTARVDAGQLVPLRGRVPLRDLDAERRLVRALQNELELAPGHRLALEPGAAIALAERLSGFGAELAGDAWREFRREAPLVPRVELAGRRFALAFESPAEGGARRADPERVLRAWRDGESLAPLAGGGFAELPRDWLERFGEPVADLLAARGEAGELPASALPDLARLAADLGLPPPPDFARLRALVDGFSGLPEAPLPSDLRAELRAYQRAGVRWLAFLRDAGLGALLADDMGLGKTLQALCAVRGRTLVVAPTSVLHNWLDETARFRPGLRAALYHGPRRALDPEADVIVTSYAILRLDAARLAAEPWGTVVLDEAQNVKNPESLAARAAFRLRADFRVALSGTPVENRLGELWSVFHFLNPGLLGGRADFDARYARPIAAGVPAAAARLRERIRPFVLRRRKREVAPELPPRTDVVLRCALGDAERAVYDAVRAASVPEVVAALEKGGSVLAALEALLRLRQAACHPALVPGQRAETSAKVELLLEQLETALAEGHRALVFSQWTSLLDLVEPHLAAAGIAFTRLDGSTRDRAGVVARFQDESGPPVLLVSLRAGGTGLNLTAADCVVLLDPWWNPAVEEQAADRAHRIGQERPVVVYRLVAENTVEERILELQHRKRELSDLALGDAQAAAALTRDDLLALLA
jgi:superfamily II DNA or RNA helicase